MPIRYQWRDANKRVIAMVFEQAWTWDDYLQVQGELFRMIDTVDHVVHYLIDIHRSRSLPLNALNKLPIIFGKTHPRRGKTVILGANATIRNIWTLLRKIVPQMGEPRYFFVASTEEADEILKEFASEG